MFSYCTKSSIVSQVSRKRNLKVRVFVEAGKVEILLRARENEKTKL